MSTPRDHLEPRRLLEHADRLLGGALNQQGRPADMDLRRAASASYYAVFHAITLAVAEKVFGQSAAAREHATRWINHDDVFTASRLVTGYTPGHLFKPGTGAERIAIQALLDHTPPGPELLDLCTKFQDLQRRRHEADYGRAVRIGMLDARVARADAGDAVRALGQLVQQRDEGVSTYLGLVAFAARRLPR